MLAAQLQAMTCSFFVCFFLILIQFLTARIAQHTPPAILYRYVYIQRLIAMLLIQLLMKNIFRFFILFEKESQEE